MLLIEFVEQPEYAKALKPFASGLSATFHALRGDSWGHAKG
ncbi:MAG TPA: hypothetical protein VER96_14925 [Polyangiaceae bacterium]|nr:hypothetical protein [Polyangiaceae bacterium]